MAIEWIKLLEGTPEFAVLTLVVPTKGYLVYEYNPFRNYRLNEDKYEYKGELYSLKELKDNFGITPSNDSKSWEGTKDSENPLLRERGELVDFITDELNFSLEHPVYITPQYSYDGSVNLILNDGLNTPKLINSRFSATGRNTYEVVDRKGNNDSNIYDLGDLFEIDTSLYKLVIKIPKIRFNGTPAGGNVKIGNYHFYFKLADADDNETDFVGESGLVSVFIGFGLPSSMHTGVINENSYKNISFTISNIDSAYDYLYVYYSRATSQPNELAVTEYMKIDKKFVVNNAGVCLLFITGFEDVVPVTIEDINLMYHVVDSAKTAVSCQNRLFLGNVLEPNIPYKELQDLSLRFLPKLHEEKYDLVMNERYEITSPSLGYYDSTFIYNKTGYWNNEFYRLGVVYILPNGQLSPVFNIRGAIDITSDFEYTHFDIESDSTRVYIDFNEETGIITGSKNLFENVKGVIRLNSSADTDIIYGIKIVPQEGLIKQLKLYVRGYFFVRQTRIPTIIAQGITLGIDLYSNTPCIPTAGGFLDNFIGELKESSHVVTNDINGVNFISEGFLSRYRYKQVKEHSGLWKKIGIAFAATVAVIASVAATVVTFGAGAPLLVYGGIAATALLGVTGTAALVTTAVMAGVVAAGVTAVAAGAQELVYKIERASHDKLALNGRNFKPSPGYKVKEEDSSRILGSDFLDRVILKDETNVKVLAILCPDYELNQPYYNSIFVGSNHLIRSTKSQNVSQGGSYNARYFTNDYNHFYVDKYTDVNHLFELKTKIVGVPDGNPLVMLDTFKFRARAGSAEEVLNYECVGNDYIKLNKDKAYNESVRLKIKELQKDNSEITLDDFTEEELEELTDVEATNKNKKINSDIIRGNFGAYLAFNDTEDTFSPAETVNIYIPDYSDSNTNDYVNIRMFDNSPYYAISDRIDILDANTTDVLGNVTETDGYVVYRGDCYICQFTHRLNRNFNDPSAPYNDSIVDEDCWRDNYDPNRPDKFNKINLGDVNAVELGMWVTFRVRSSNNLNIRTLDGSEVGTAAAVGHPKGFYPYHPMSTEGSYKHPDSLIYNHGFAKSLSDRWNVEAPDGPAIKNWFGTRILYSDIHINDAYKNGFRVFRGTNFRDYTREYGEIVKLISLESDLLCVFEHGVALIEVNGRTLIGQGSGGMVYVNNANVLPENPKVLSDMFGSLWADSVIKVPGKSGDAILYVYGIDTVAKKIWRTDGLSFECISDFRVQEFLNNNISLGERELTPKLGIRNVKTHYNAYKRDVMFTFYDNTYGFEEKVWNLCWNEILLKFVTFYSWVPSYMENINNVPFSFDRNTSKWITKLGVSHANNSFADGITLSSVIIDEPTTTVLFEYIDSNGLQLVKDVSFSNIDDWKPIAVLGLCNRVLPEDSLKYEIHYSLEKDSSGNYLDFAVLRIPVDNTKEDDSKYSVEGASYTEPVYGLYYKGDITKFYSELYYRNKARNVYADTDKNQVYCGGLKDPENPESERYSIKDILDRPIYKDITGKRPTLDRKDMLNPDKIVRLLNIKATIKIITEGLDVSLSDHYYNTSAKYATGSTLIDAGYYESTVAVTPKWNMLFLSTDFWKHGLAGIIDIADDIFPTYWYGKQHPFEFEFIVVDDPSIHKIFTNLEIISNKAKPESFHYEVIGESYDFAKDKPNMYFRQEARKAIWQCNGSDITYNPNFLETKLKLQNRSADLINKYYARIDTINEIEDYYLSKTTSDRFDYRHLSGAEITYYPNRQEYRVWNHALAIDLNSLSQDDARSIITANCQYLEDKWKVTINPILICYKNEGKLWKGETTWKGNYPPIPVMNSPIPDKALNFINNNNGNVFIPNFLPKEYQDGTLFDTTDWLNEVDIYAFGKDLNRKETDVRDKFMKVRIRYSGEDLAVIDFINTIYKISYS